MRASLRCIGCCYCFTATLLHYLLLLYCYFTTARTARCGINVGAIVYKDPLRVLKELDRLLADYKVLVHEALRY